MRSPWTAGGLQKGAIATMTTGRRATATAVTARSIKWIFPERVRTAGGVRTGAAGRREDGTGPSTTEAGLHPDTGAEIAAGTQTAAVTLLNEISQLD